MKRMKFILLQIALIATITFTAMKVLEDHSEATVEQYHGYYIFYMSKPKAEYTYLGNVTCPTFVKSKLPKGIFETMVKQVEKNYPKADGILFNTYEMTSAQAIMFKE